MRLSVAQLELQPIRGRSEEELLLQLSQGSSQAFAEVYRRYARYVATIGFRLLGDDSELDDLVQETFLQVSSGIDTLRDPKGFRSWLATIAVRSVWRRRAQRRRRQLLHRALAAVGLSRSDPADRKPVDDLYEELDRMPERCRMPWLLHRVMGETLPDAAAMCGISLTTTKRRVAEAAARLTSERGPHAG